MKVKQVLGTRGSLKWIQRLSRRPELLERELRSAGAMGPNASFEWISPSESDAWSEYRDGAFLAAIGQQNLSPALKAFWPRGGPQWDGLGRDSTGAVYLIEAKAHLAEMASTCQASTDSEQMITRAFAGTKAKLGAFPSSDWLRGYYQYANRLAHLHFLRDQGVDARLIFLYFTNDSDMGGPESRDAWERSSQAVKQHLGLPADREIPGLHNIYLDSRILN
jgi:hypothetical protein